MNSIVSTFTNSFPEWLLLGVGGFYDDIHAVAGFVVGHGVRNKLLVYILHIIFPGGVKEVRRCSNIINGVIRRSC